MKKSKKVSLIASLLYVVVTLAVLAATKPLLGIMAGPMPLMVYVLSVLSLVCPLVTYFLVPYVEKLEEQEAKKGE